MYKLLIVDDEPYIVEGLADLLGSNPDFDIYTAASGNSALEILDRIRMDIVLTDIQMPGKNGLELLKEIHNRWPFCRTIILTAYSDFDYAYLAIENKAVDYVLKTEGEDAIVAAVNQCIEQIEDEMRQQKFLEESREQMDSVMSIIQNSCLINALEGEAKEVCAQEFHKYNIELDTGRPVLLMGVRIDRFSPEDNSKDKLNYLIQLGKIFDKYLDQFFICYQTSYQNKNMIWLLQARNADGSVHRLKETLEIIQQHCWQALGLSISVIYDDFIDWQELNNRYKTVRLVLEQLTINGDDGILASTRFYRDRKDSADVNKKDRGNDWGRNFQNLQTCLEEEDREGVEKVLDDLLSESEEDRATLPVKLQLYHTVVGALLSYLNNRALSEEVFTDQTNFELFFSYSDRAEMKERIMKLIEQILDVNKKNRESHSEKFAARIKNYIKANLGGDLSLAAISERFYINPVYMSRLFKQTTGINLSDYITAERINYSKKLLVETEMKIHMIAKEAGYDSPAYFIRIFKKMERVTPQEYRNLAAGENVSM